MRPTYGKTFSSKFHYLREDVPIGFWDFQNPKISEKSEIRRFPLDSISKEQSEMLIALENTEFVNSTKYNVHRRVKFLL